MLKSSKSTIRKDLVSTSPKTTWEKLLEISISMEWKKKIPLRYKEQHNMSFDNSPPLVDFYLPKHIISVWLIFEISFHRLYLQFSTIFTCIL